MSREGGTGPGPIKVVVDNDIQKIRMQLWCDVNMKHQCNRGDGHGPSRHANDAVDLFDKKFNINQEE